MPFFYFLFCRVYFVDQMISICEYVSRWVSLFMLPVLAHGDGEERNINQKDLVKNVKTKWF